MESILILDRLIRSIKYIFKEEEIDLTLNECQVLYLVKEHKTRSKIINNSSKDKSYVHRQLESLSDKGLIFKSQINNQQNLMYKLTDLGESKLKKVISISRICEYRWHIDKVKRSKLKELLLEASV